MKKFYIRRLKHKWKTEWMVSDFSYSLMIMIRKVTYIIILTGLFGLTIHSQIDKSAIIQKKISSERKIIKQFIKDDKLDSIKVFETLNTSDYSILTNYEEEKYYLISGQFEKFIEFANKKKKIKSTNRFSYLLDNQNYKYRYSSYFNDALEKSIDNYIKTHEELIIQKIKLTNLKQEDKEFVKLMIDYYKLCSNFCDEHIGNNLLINSKKFIAKYPNSSYLPVVNNHLKIKYKESNWGAGVFINSGFVLPTGNLPNYFTSGIFIDGGITLNYKRIYHFAGVGPALGGKIKQNLFYQKEWKSGDDFIYASGEWLLGYNIINKDKLGITPLFGIGGAGLSPFSQQDKNYYKDVENIVPSNFFVYVINLDYRFNRTDCSNLSIDKKGLGALGDAFGYMIARLSITYSSPRYYNSVSDLSGNLWFIKIGFGTQFQFKKRIHGYNKSYAQ